MKIKRRTVALLVAPCIVFALAWVAGFDFNVRGFNALFVSCMALWLMFVAAIVPWGDDE